MSQVSGSCFSDRLLVGEAIEGVGRRPTHFTLTVVFKLGRADRDENNFVPVDPISSVVVTLKELPFGVRWGQPVAHAAELGIILSRKLRYG